MKVIFRADASLQIGTGHVMRCLTLADALTLKGAQCQFICREHAGNLIELIRSKGYVAHVLPCEPKGAVDHDGPAHSAWLGTTQVQDAQACQPILRALQPDWLIVDHYALDIRWEERLQPDYRRLMVLDDLADRSHACHVLLDHNLGRKSMDYAGLVPKKCIVLAGPQYALLRPEFAALREYSLERRKQPKLQSLLIAMGGVDQPNATGVVLDALKFCPLPVGCKITVVMGGSALWSDRVREIAATMPWPTEVRIDITDMAQVMADNDLAFGAAGSTSWERCCLGVPTLLVPIAENQKAGAIALSASNAVILFNGLREVECGLVKVIKLFQSGHKLKIMVDAAASICDGTGVSRLVSVLEYLSSGKLVLRQAEKSDARLLYNWANDPVTRGNALKTEPIDWSTHQSWFRNKLENKEGCLIVIASLTTSIPCGQVRFERDEGGSWVIDYSLAPEFRGMRLGRVLLANALSYLAEIVPNANVVGKVKVVNTPSCRIFEKLGFFVDASASNELVTFRRAL